MTANQMITLLQAYRGTLGHEFRVGTFENDIKHLVATGFLMNGRRDGYPECTPLAYKWIRDEVLKGPQ